MRDSIESMCRFRRAGIEQGSTGALHLDGFESLTSAKKENPHRMVWVSFCVRTLILKRCDPRGAFSLLRGVAFRPRGGRNFRRGVADAFI